MGQREVYDFLKEQRGLNDNWFTVNDIKQDFLNKGNTKNYIRGIFSDLHILASFNIIEFRGVGVWGHHKEFRAKKNG